MVPFKEEAMVEFLDKWKERLVFRTNVTESVYLSQLEVEIYVRNCKDCECMILQRGVTLAKYNLGSILLKMLLRLW